MILKGQSDSNLPSSATSRTSGRTKGKKYVKEIDVPQNQVLKESFDLKYIDTEEITSKLEKIFDAKKIVFLGDPRITSEVKSLSISTIFISQDPSSGEIVILSPSENMKQIEKLINQWTKSG